MAKQYTYSIGPVSASARGKTAAKQICEEKAAAALSALEQGPLMFVVPSNPEGIAAVLIAPTIYGQWEYVWLDKDPSVRSRCSCTAIDSRDAALWTAVSHVGQLLNETTSLDEIEAWAAAVLQDPGQAIVLRSELRDRRAWHRRYASWKQQGATDTEAHRGACEGRLPEAGATNV
jgi:hypothetical protein